MSRDIDQIIERLRVGIPGIQVTQLQVAHSGADDADLWYIRIPNRTEEVQVESLRGSCPFLIESDFSSEKFHGHNVDEVVSIITKLYASGCRP